MTFKKKLVSPLVKEKIVVKLIKRNGSWLEQIDKNHDGANLWSEAKVTFTGVPFDLKSGRNLDPLTNEERDWFESPESGLGLEKNEMSVLRKDNYWENFTVALTRNGTTIDKGDVIGYLRWKYLLSLPQIAPSWEQRFNSAEYKFALVSEDQVLLERVKKSDLKKHAHMFMGKVDSSPTKMITFLDMYFQKNNIKDRKIPDNASREFLVGEFDKLIETNIVGFLDVAQDEDYKTKEFIYSSLRKGLIVKTGKAKYSIMGDTETFSFTELVEYFKSPESNKIHEKMMRQLNAV